MSHNKRAIALGGMRPAKKSVHVRKRAAKGWMGGQNLAPALPAMLVPPHQAARPEHQGVFEPNDLLDLVYLG